MSYYRTPENRKLRAKLIRRWKPWEKSTGPRTDEGKAKSAGNSRKHGARSKQAIESGKLVRAYIKLCKECVDE